MTPHNEAKLGEIAKTVLMPGDPLRAKYIANHFMTDVKLINDVRNIYAYTGKYKNKKITIFPSGMGMPSIGIYCYELFKFYNVENIIRIGSCGALIPELQLNDIVLVDKSYTSGNYSLTLTGVENHIENSSPNLNHLIMQTAEHNNINITIGNACCTEIFGIYCEPQAFDKRFSKDLKLVVSEMEAFALFAIANMFNKNASCLLTVVDSLFIDQHVSVDDREKSLNKMIKLALDSTLKL